MTFPEDTIFAPATSVGSGAVTIIRVSGRDALSVVSKVVSFRNPGMKGGSVKYGTIAGLDEVLVSIFRAPHSYTGEDSAEICCHASRYIAGGIMDLLRQAGARMAEPGEFTRRAYLAGKMDLSQAEAVADLIAADSQAAHRAALHQLKGAYSLELKGLRDQLVELTSLLELELDFSEEDVEFADRSRLLDLLDKTIAHCNSLAESFRDGNAIKTGVPTAIVGAPNSGKSTLLNALLGEDRAIVSDVPGTTRDTVEEVMTIDGVQYRFIDTAGLRESSDSVERIGIERSLSAARKARIILAITDASSSKDDRAPECCSGSESDPRYTADSDPAMSRTSVSESCNAPSHTSDSESCNVPSHTSGSESDPAIRQILSGLESWQTLIVVRNKCDKVEATALTGSGDVDFEGNGAGGVDCRVNTLTDLSGGVQCPVVNISALKGCGIDRLKTIISQSFNAGHSADETMVTNARHHAALLQASSQLCAARKSLENGLSGDLVSEDLRSAITSLNSIFGEQIGTEEVLGEIFGRFCIGK